MSSQHKDEKNLENAVDPVETERLAEDAAEASVDAVADASEASASDENLPASSGEEAEGEAHGDVDGQDPDDELAALVRENVAEDKLEAPLNPDSGAPSPDSPAPAEDPENLPPRVQHAHKAGSPPPPPNPEDEPMSLLGHLGELRRRLTRCMLIILLGFVACYGFSTALYDFVSGPLIVALPEGSNMIYTSPQGAFFTYLKVSLMASIFLTSPFSFFQVWSFIAPGLYKEEKKVVMPLALLSALFFLSGATFCYLLVFPLAFQFFMGFATDVIVPMISVEEYLSFALKLLIAFGVVFEMPLFAFFLGRMGILTPAFMRSKRQYAILMIFAVAAILTPPDVFSQVLMALPMILLYEVSIFVAGWARKKKLEGDGKTADKPEESHEQA